MFRIALLSLYLLRANTPLFSQSQGITLAGSGYSDRTAIQVAPGQITTFFVTGLKTILPSGSVSATSVPLPASLAGISVTFNQPGQKSYIAGLLALKQIPVCVGSGSSGSPSPSPAPDCLLTAITAQVPFELPDLAPQGGPIDTALVVSENGNASAGFRVFPMRDNVHILNTCDAFPPVSSKTVSCQPVVTHGDGTLVTADAPAKAGEEIVIYAFGLGKGGLGFLEGEYLLFDLAINAGPKNPQYPRAPGAIPTSNYVGLVAGYVGLYQVNITIPRDLVTPVACGDYVRSNLTIDYGEIFSFDGAPICIQATR